MYVFTIVLTDCDNNEIPKYLDIPDLDLSLECRGTAREALAFAASEIKKDVLRRLVENTPIPQSESIPPVREGERIIALALSVELPEDELYSVEQTMDILGVSQPRVSHLIRDGKLVAVKRERKNYLTKASLESYLATPRTAGRPSTREYGVEHFTNTLPELP